MSPSSQSARRQPDQPSVVVLPVPDPYGSQRISNIAIEASLPDAVGVYVDWLINESGWKVSERPSAMADATTARGFQPGEHEHLVRIQARHICLLFRRFVSYGQDMTRPYVRALEARAHPASARRRTVVSQSRGDRDAARGAERNRMAGGRAVGICDVARKLCSR